MTPTPVMEPDLVGKRVAFWDKNGATRLAMILRVRRKDLRGKLADGRKLTVPKGEVQHVQTPTLQREITWLNDDERRGFRWPQGKAARRARRGA